MYKYGFIGELHRVRSRVIDRREISRRPTHHNVCRPPLQQRDVVGALVEAAVRRVLRLSPHARDLELKSAA